MTFFHKLNSLYMKHSYSTANWKISTYNPWLFFHSIIKLLWNATWKDVMLRCQTLPKMPCAQKRSKAPDSTKQPASLLLNYWYSLCRRLSVTCQIIHTKRGGEWASARERERKRKFQSDNVVQRKIIVNRCIWSLQQSSDKYYVRARATSHMNYSLLKC